MEDTLIKPTNEEEFVQELQKYDYIRLNFVDLNGLHLGKLLSTKYAPQIASGGNELYSGIITFGPRFELVDIPYVVSQRSVNNRLVPDFRTLHPCPWAGSQNPEKSDSDHEQRKKYNVCAVICDMQWPTGESMKAYPRTVVKRLLNELKEKHHISLMSAFEPEFRAFKTADVEDTCLKPLRFSSRRRNPQLKELIPFTSGDDMYKTSYLAVYENFFMDIDTQLRKAGILIQDFSNENGEAQLECPLIAEFGIDAADHYFILKQAIKEIGLKHDMVISFMTTPLFQDSSSGCHFNHSLWHANNGLNILYDPEGCDKLSDFARYWIGGLLTHLPAMMAFCSPTINCYRRLHRRLAPDIANWDIDDRFTSLRVRNRDEKRTYIENRIPSSASCPYHVMAATIAAGLDGIERKLKPPRKGIKRMQDKFSEEYTLLPNTLHEAVEALRADQHFVEKIGTHFVDWFIQVKERSDMETLGNVNVRDNSEFDLAHERYEYLQYM